MNEGGKLASLWEPSILSSSSRDEFVMEDTELNEHGLSMVWRPLVARFTPDPDLIYWVPPLYNSHFVRLQESLAMDSLRMSQRMTPSGFRNYGESSSFSALETRDNPFEPNSKIKKDFLCYEQEKSPEKGRYKKTNGTCLSSGRKNSYEIFSAPRPRVGSVDNSVTFAIYKDERQQQNVRLRSRSASFTPKNFRDISRNLRRISSSLQAVEYTSRDKADVLHSFATHNLASFDFSQIRKTEWAVFQGEEVSFLEELRPDNQTQDCRGKLQSKRLYFIAVFLLLLLAIVVVIVVVLTYRQR